MINRTAARLGVTAAVAGLVLAGCGSTPSEPAPSSAPPPPSPTGPDPALVSWAGGYCGAVKDMRLIVYSLARSFDITTEADLPKASASLEKLDTALVAAIGGLEKLPQVAPPAQEANTLASGELAFYRKLHGKVTEYRALLPRGGVEYAKAALNLSGADLVTHTPSVETGKVPGLDQAMKADKACELVG
ncbi:hypothetical protein [Amycolatopsis azurea]|uniref:Lipoprotein n=1 Tax=Amycolatopsis azurea DSM 43854 TaxID=1238180 RepID=M2NSR4_9PSEU|nr:hypothetical protein [Amycolatopsis azurea]EMD25404.1 hypothetical protein C791_4844 [Amycolatopsis azurea DSM 43854]OOC00576.1 hypothetical protein B0293_42525 [Amycolatopsis azurea DSM 43854]